MAPRIVPLFTHQDFFIFDKPSGYSFHSEAGPGFFSALQQAFPDEKLYPAHRLDKCTSGLLLVARNAAAASAFTELFTRGKIQKTYIALSNKRPSKKQGSVRGDMARSRNGSWKLTRNQTNPAITHFFTLATENAPRLFVLLPKTGKTHQLRVMMKTLGSPILGDTRYSGEPSDRTYLHAFEIKFRWENKLVTCRSIPTTGAQFINLEAVFSRLPEAFAESGY